MPEFDPAGLSERDRYFLLASLVVPRPIAWVSSLAADGTRNLAPHSFYNIVSADPPVVHFTQTGPKDSLRNVLETGEFVISVVSYDCLEPMNLTGAAFPPEEDEFEWAKLEAVPSVVVAPPRVAAAKAAMECRVRQTLQVGDGHMVFGDVVHIHVDEAVWRDGRVDQRLLAPLGRLGGPVYSPVTEVERRPTPVWDPETRTLRCP